MVWFSEDVLSVEMIFENYLLRLCNIPVEETEEDAAFMKKAEKKSEDEITPTLQVIFSNEKASYVIIVLWLKRPADSE